MINWKEYRKAQARARYELRRPLLAQITKLQQELDARADALTEAREENERLKIGARAVLEAIVYDAQRCGTVIWIRPPYAAEAVHESVADRLCEMLGIEIEEVLSE